MIPSWPGQAGQLQVPTLSWYVKWPQLGRHMPRWPGRGLRFLLLLRMLPRRLHRRLPLRRLFFAAGCYHALWCSFNFAASSSAGPWPSCSRPHFSANLIIVERLSVTPMHLWTHTHTYYIPRRAPLHDAYHNSAFPGHMPEGWRCDASCCWLRQEPDRRTANSRLLCFSWFFEPWLYIIYLNIL